MQNDQCPSTANAQNPLNSVAGVHIRQPCITATFSDCAGLVQAAPMQSCCSECRASCGLPCEDEEVLPGSVGRMPDSSNTAAMNWESAQHSAHCNISNAPVTAWQLHLMCLALQHRVYNGAYSHVSTMWDSPVTGAVAWMTCQLRYKHTAASMQGFLQSAKNSKIHARGKGCKFADDQHTDRQLVCVTVTT